MLDMNASAIDYAFSATCQQARFPSPAQDAALASPTPQIDVDNDNYSCSNVCPKAGTHGGKRLLSDTSKYNWVPCHNRPEILTYLDGRKRWFHCSLPVQPGSADNSSSESVVAHTSPPPQAGVVSELKIQPGAASSTVLGAQEHGATIIEARDARQMWIDKVKGIMREGMKTKQTILKLY
jgi:hypothetical protein